jgi:transposase
MQPSPQNSPNKRLIIGIDWADREHAVCLIEPDGRVHFDSLEQQPEVIAAWAAELAQKFPGLELLVAVEQSRGALFHALLAVGSFRLYPVNPKQLARYREAIYPSGGKGDPTDAELLARFLEYHQPQLRPWQPDCEQTRRIGHLAEFRRKLVDERKSVTLRLGSTLKLYFPLIIEHFGKRLTSPLVIALLKRWPSLDVLRRAHPKTLRTFFREHGLANKEQQTKLIEAIRAAVPLTRDRAIVDSHATYVQALCDQLHGLNKSMEQFDAQLAEAVAQHPDAKIYRSLPGAGDVLVPRLIAAVGSDRNRYESAHQLQCYSGIAPVTRQSGKVRYVSKRYACPKFLRQTFHEFADHARKWSDWSKAFYRMKRAAGMKHNAAVRALAFKWIRIIFRLWKTSETYSEVRFIEQLKTRNSPIVNFLETNEK